MVVVVTKREEMPFQLTESAECTEEYTEMFDESFLWFIP